MPRLIRSAVGLALMTPLMMVVGIATARAGGGFCHGAPVTDTSTDRVVIADYCFTPTIVRVGVGDPVTWLNKDGTPHAVAGANGSWAGDGDLHMGDKATVRFAKAGIYPYLCSLHPGMIGAVVVGEEGAAEVAGAAIPAALATGQPPAASRETTFAAATDNGSESSLPWKVSTFAASALFAALLAFVVARKKLARGTDGEGPERNLQRSLS